MINTFYDFLQLKSQDIIIISLFSSIEYYITNRINHEAIYNKCTYKSIKTIIFNSILNSKIILKQGKFVPKKEL